MTGERLGGEKQSIRVQLQIPKNWACMMEAADMSQIGTPCENEYIVAMCVADGLRLSNGLVIHYLKLLLTTAKVREEFGTMFWGAHLPRVSTESKERHYKLKGT